MKYNRIFSVYISGVLSVFLFLSVVFPKEIRADKDNSGIGKQIVGTYLLNEDDGGGFRIVTLTVDGNWFGIHSYQLNSKFSNQQGVWKELGERMITAEVINFSLLKDGVGSSLFSFTVKFDKAYRQVSGELLGKLFPVGVDPLDPVAVPIKTFSNTFTGKRLTISGK